MPPIFPPGAVAGAGKDAPQKKQILIKKYSVVVSSPAASAVLSFFLLFKLLFILLPNYIWRLIV
jgi:hypothetical protein